MIATRAVYQFRALQSLLSVLTLHGDARLKHVSADGFNEALFLYLSSLLLAAFFRSVPFHSPTLEGSHTLTFQRSSDRNSFSKIRSSIHFSVAADFFTMESFQDEIILLLRQVVNIKTGRASRL